MPRFSSDAFAPKDRLEVLEDAVATRMLRFRSVPAPGKTPYWEAETADLGSNPTLAVGGFGFRATRTRTEIARTSKLSYLACVMAGGTTSITCQGGTDTTLSPGDVFLIDSAHEFTLGMEQSFRHLVVMLPATTLEARLPRTDAFHGTVLSALPMARLFGAYLAAGIYDAPSLSESQAALFEQHLTDLLGAALVGPDDEAPPAAEAWRAATFTRAKRLIALKLGDSELRPGTIAEGLGISTRTLHRVFAAHGTTVMSHVFAERVKSAAKLLAAPQARHRTITEIAFACGFNDASHFGRVFSEHIGVTPSEWRKRWR